MLEDCLKPWALAHFGNRPYTFQQDSAPAHKATETQRWLAEKVPSFISASQWPSCSPDLNPLDFSIWGILKTNVCCKKYTSVETLKSAILCEREKIPDHTVSAACEAFDHRLQQIIRAKGGYVES